ncbi:hypothetical protein AAC387_Pa02g3828 [Persea americana]
MAGSYSSPWASLSMAGFSSSAGRTIFKSKTAPAPPPPAASSPGAYVEAEEFGPRAGRCEAPPAAHIGF